MKDTNAFTWEDPLLLDDLLTEEERMIRDAARGLCAGQAAAAGDRGLPRRAYRPGDLPRDGRARAARRRPFPRNSAVSARATSPTA